MKHTETTIFIHEEKYLSVSQNPESSSLKRKSELSSLTHWVWDSRKQIQSYALTLKLLFLTQLRFLAPLVEFPYNKL